MERMRRRKEAHRLCAIVSAANYNGAGTLTYYILPTSLYAAAIAAAHAIFVYVAACRGSSGPADNVYVAQGLAALAMLVSLVAMGYSTKQIDELISANSVSKIMTLSSFNIILFTFELITFIVSVVKPGQD
jgi:hypothetical protein